MQLSSSIATNPRPRCSTGGKGRDCLDLIRAGIGIASLFAAPDLLTLMSATGTENNQRGKYHRVSNTPGKKKQCAVYIHMVRYSIHGRNESRR